MDAEQFGPYRLEALVGRGGMGEVYRAFDTEHEREVALKVLSEHLAGDSGYRERFRREAHLAARLNEPHIVPIHRYGEIEGRLFLDMRLVAGRDVAAVLAQEGPMTAARAVSVVSQVARALDSAHADGLVHRDVKPSNILLTGQGDDEFVYLVDFGIARSTMESSGPALTQTGAALGSFDYMAPERFLEKPIDRRVDVYALACVLFECLTGRRPFLGDGLATLMYAHLSTDAPAPSSLRPELPQALDDVVRTGLAKDPGQRYGAAGELAAAGRAALQEAGVTPKPEVRVPHAPPTSITPLPVRPRTVGFSDPGLPAGAGPPSNPGRFTGYGVPSDPGPPGYRPPSHPGVPTYGPPSHPGAPAYGPPSDPGRATFSPTAGGPGWAAVAAPSPEGTRRRNPVPWILGVAVLLTVLVVVGAFVLVGGMKGGNGGGGATGTTNTDTTTPSTSPSAPASTEDRLRALLPQGFRRETCRTTPLAGDGDVAALDCGRAQIQPGPDTSAFYLYPSASTLDQAFLGDAQSANLGELPSGTDCPDGQGYEDYNDGNGHRLGQLGCYVEAGSNDAVLFWTQDDHYAEGVVAVSGGGAAGLATLVTWWKSGHNSAFGG